MKLFPLIFITVVLCQVDASTVFGRMTIGRPRRPSGVPFCTQPPRSTTPSQLQFNYFSDCLLWLRECLAAQQQSLKQCPSCKTPSCPPCANQNHAMIQPVKRGPATTGYSARPSEELSTQKPLSEDCTPSEIEIATEELVHKVAAILPTVCFMRKSSLLPPFHLIDYACVFRGAGVLGFIKHHLLELIEYLQRHSFLSEEGFFGRDENGSVVVIPYSSRSLCRRQILSQTSSVLVERNESSSGLQNNQEQRTTPHSKDSSAHQPVTEILRR